MIPREEGRRRKGSGFGYDGVAQGILGMGFFCVFTIMVTQIRTQNKISGKQASTQGFPCGSDGKEATCNAGDLGSTSGSGRSPGRGNGNPLQYSCLGSSMDRGAWWATVHGVAHGRT